MVFPEVTLRPGESVYKADERVERAFEASGLALTSLADLGGVAEGGSPCHFFLVTLEDRQAIVVVFTSAWDERALVQVLNVLLELRMDPDPPGSQVAVRFYSAHEVPAILSSVFGDSDACRFESRALLVSRFGHDVQAESCLRIAAAAAFLAYEHFGRRVGFDSGDAVGEIEGLVERFRVDEECIEPVNSLVALGCLFGEVVRSSSPQPLEWWPAPAGHQWPVLAETEDSSEDESTRYSPIAQVIRAYQSGAADHLASSRATFVRSLRADR